MKTIQIIILFIGLTLSISSCNKVKRVKASGDITKIEKTVTAYSKVDISSAFDVDVTYSDTEETVIVEADDNIQDLIIVENDNDKLIIRFQKLVNIRGKATLKVHLTTKELNGFELSGASTMTLNNELDATNVSIDLSGASTFDGAITATDVSLDLSGASKLDGVINATNAAFQLTGASNIDISGTIEKLDLDGDGASTIKNYELETDFLKVDLSGASVLHVTVNNDLDVIASGASQVKYKGTGVIVNQNLSGASTLKKED